jgi:hypothetical protein
MGHAVTVTVVAFVLVTLATNVSLAQLFDPLKPPAKGTRPRWTPKTSSATYDPSKVNCERHTLLLLETLLYIVAEALL